jgi:hypothetical protein
MMLPFESIIDVVPFLFSIAVETPLLSIIVDVPFLFCITLIIVALPVFGLGQQAGLELQLVVLKAALVTDLHQLNHFADPAAYPLPYQCFG